MPQFDAGIEFNQQNLSLRHVKVQNHEAFGGGGKDLGAAFSLIAAVCHFQSVDFLDNAQTGVGAGVIYATGSSVNFAFVRFDRNRNDGIGAGVLTASAGSHILFSHSQILGSQVENKIGVVGVKGSCDERDWPAQRDWEGLSVIGRADVRSSDQICGECTVMVNFKHQLLHSENSCDGYCAGLGRQCVGSWTLKEHTSCAIGTTKQCSSIFPGGGICQCSSTKSLDAYPTKPASCIMADASVISATHSLFEGNVGGDVITARASSEVNVDHTTFQFNVGGAEKGQRRQGVDSSSTPYWLLGASATISLWEGSVATLVATSFIGNVGAAAGALLAAGIGTIVTFDAVEFHGNRASTPDAAAGAIFAGDGAQVHGSQSTFYTNAAVSPASAGAVYAIDTAEMTLTDVTLSNNIAVAHPIAGAISGAGAVYASRASVSLIRATIAINTHEGTTKDGATHENFADALYVTSPLHIFVKDSTFEPLVWGGKTVSISPQILPGTIVQGSCQQHPCTPGNSCTYANFSASCQPCPDGTYSAGGTTCELCPPSMKPSADQTRCEVCGGPDDPLAYSPFGICLECHGQNVVSNDRTSCLPCSLGLGPANDQRTHCAPCGGDTMSKLGICEACPDGKVGDGVGIACSDCPPNAEPSNVQLQCRCKPGHYNTSFGWVQCKPDQMPAPQDGFVCQPCGPCLNCDKPLTTFARALVRPGYKLGVAASKTYNGVERGRLHLNKVFHPCRRDICMGESRKSALSRDTIRLALTMTNVDTETLNVESDARSVFGAAFYHKMAQVLAVSPDDIAIDTITVTASSRTLRRWLQDLADTTVSFTITIASDTTESLMARIDALRNASATTTKVDSSVADTSTFTQPVIVLHSEATGIQCAEGHDPASPLCHVCTEGFVEGMDMMCFECDAEDTSISSEISTVLLCMGIIVVTLLAFVAHRLYRGYAERGERKDAGEMRWVKPTFTAGGSAPLSIYAKICISHYQILTQFRK
jgi:hypothetical protein